MGRASVSFGGSNTQVHSKSGKYVKSCSVKYELMKNKLLDDFVAEYPLLDDASQDDLSEEDVSSDEKNGSIDGSNRGRR